MPIGTFGGLNTAFSGVVGSQRNLEITSKNIANSATKGYSRQEVLHEGVPAPRPGMYGDPLAPPGGVNLVGYRRIRDELLDRRLYDQVPTQTNAETRFQYLSQVEGVFNEPSDNTGMNALMNKFFNAFKEASNTATQTPARQAILDKAGTLVTALHDSVAHIDRTSAQVSDELAVRLDEINKAAAQVESLTKEIRVSIAQGETPNDLMDRRDLLFDQLSELGNITVARSDDGNVDVTFGGFALVSGGTAASATATDLAATSNGRYSGLLALQNTVLPGQRNALNAIAAGMITAVNAQHALGNTLSGAAGGAFFSGTDAASISVAVTDPANIALSGDGAAGNGGNALALADVINTPGTVGTQSIKGAYQSFVVTLGTDVQTAEHQAEVAQNVADALRDSRDAVSAVSLDEEMSNLIRFQTGYGAASRAVSAMDQMLDTLVNRTGKVGL